MQEYVILIGLGIAWIVSIFFSIYKYKKIMSSSQRMTSSVNFNQFEIDEGVTDELLSKVPDWLSKHGVKEYGAIPPSRAPLGKRATEVLETYSRVVSDYKDEVLSRDFLFQEYADNPAFVQIGDNDVNIILMKKNSEDETVYNVYKDEPDESNPAVYASSIDHYLAMEMRLEEGCERTIHE